MALADDLLAILRGEDATASDAEPRYLPMPRPMALDIPREPSTGQPAYRPEPSVRIPSSYWERVGERTGGQPFGHVPFVRGGPAGTNSSPLLALAALVAGFANARAQAGLQSSLGSRAVEARQVAEADRRRAAREESFRASRDQGFDLQKIRETARLRNTDETIAPDRGVQAVISHLATIPATIGDAARIGNLQRRMEEMRRARPAALGERAAKIDADMASVQSQIDSSIAVAQEKAAKAAKEGKAGSFQDYSTFLQRVQSDNDMQKFQVVRDSWATIQSTTDSGPGDISLLYSFMRIVDPGSTVREGEFATAQNTAGVPDWLRNQYNRATSGERLTPNQREKFKAEAKSIYSSRLPQYRRLINQYGNLADKFGLDKDVVLRDYTAPEVKTAPKTPPPPRLGVIRVRRKADGTTGTLDSEAEFDPKLYERIE